MDVAAATRRGIVVCNAPESNAISAAEHAIALLLAQARNIPQAHASLVGGRWERSRFGGVEVTGKTLGVLGFGRIGQLVAQRARGLGMSVVAYDPFVADSRFRELGVERADTPEQLYGRADFITLHLASTPETRGLVGREAFAAMRPGTRIINAARGDVLDTDALVEALAAGRLGGAAVDVFPQEPTTESPLFGLPGVVVTPHLGASTVEAQDRAGVAVAEQVAAALSGGVVTTAVNIPALSPETIEVLGPLLPAGPPARPARGGALGRPPGPARALLRGPPGRSRHAPPHHLGARRHPARPGRGGREPGQRRRPGARSAASSGRRPPRPGPATTPTASTVRAGRGARSAAPRWGRPRARGWSRPSTRTSRSSWRPTSGSSATWTCPG